MTKRVITFEIPFDSNAERNTELMRMCAHEAIEYGDAVCDSIEYDEGDDCEGVDDTLS